MSKILLYEKMYSNDKYVGNLTMIKLENGITRVGFDTYSDFPMSLQFTDDIKKEHLEYQKSVKGNGNYYLSGNDRHLLMDCSQKDGHDIYNDLKNKLLNYFDGQIQNIQ